MGVGHYLGVAWLLTELGENSVFPRKRTRTSENAGNCLNAPIFFSSAHQTIQQSVFGQWQLPQRRHFLSLETISNRFLVKNGQKTKKLLPLIYSVQL